MFLLAASTAKGSALDLSFFKFLSILKQLEISSKLFNIEIERVVQLSGTEVADFTQLEVLDVVNDRGTDGTPMIFGNITFNQLLDDSFTVVIETFKKQFGEYQKLPSFVAEKNLCDHFREDIYYFEELCEVSDLDYPPQCPFESVSWCVDKKEIHLMSAFRNLTLCGAFCLP